MESSGVSVAATDSDDSSPISSFSITRFLRVPVTTIFECSGVLRPNRSSNAYRESESLIPSNHHSNRNSGVSDAAAGGSDGNGEISIRIMGGGEQEGAHGEVNGGDDGGGEGEVADSGGGYGGNRSDNDGDWWSQQRYDLRQVSRWIEHILPFSLLLLVVFIRQHLQGFFVTIYVTSFMYKSNDILRKQTALKGERKLYVLAGYSVVFMVHVIGVYRWYWNGDLCYPLFMVPPKAIPPFWHAIFVIVVNDTMVRQAAMTVKLLLLMYYKNSRGPNFRRQGQMLTLVEYTLLLYRAFLPAPVWYRFFLNKEYGSLFSSLTTGLYLTCKLTSIVDKVGSFYAALKALSRKEVHYGSYATPEQVLPSKIRTRLVFRGGETVSKAGDLCAICQEKMQAPISLCCNHIFCEDCVSEWFERERTCPLCRALVRPADLQSFGDGSTTLFFRLF